MRINYDFGDLEAFLALMETGSFARAADRLALSQPALSRRLQKLETALGTALFVRSTRSVKPTLAARELQVRAEVILAAAEEAAIALGTGRSGHLQDRRAIVSVAAVPTATRSLLPDAIQAFRRAGYNARVRIADLSANDVLDAVTAGEADFGINFVGTQEPGLDFRILRDDPFVLAMPANDPLKEIASVRWRDIDPNRFIAVWKGSGNRMLIDAALAKERLSLAWAYEVRHLSTALDLVEAGLGVTALPQSTLPGHGHPLIAARPLTNPVVARGVGVLRRTGARLSEAAEALYAALTEG